MALGPVQMLVLGFAEPNFTGKIAAELDRLREHEFVKIVDALVVSKDDEGNITELQVTDLSLDESIEMGAIAGALIGFGYGEGDEEAIEAGAELGAEAMAEKGGHLIPEEDAWYVADAIPNGSAAAIILLEHLWAIPLRERDRRCRRHRARRRVDPRQRPDRGRCRCSSRVERALPKGWPRYARPPRASALPPRTSPPRRDRSRYSTASRYSTTRCRPRSGRAPAQQELHRAARLRRADRRAGRSGRILLPRGCRQDAAVSVRDAAGRARLREPAVRGGRSRCSRSAACSSPSRSATCPGTAGHKPAEGFKTGGAVPPIELPGIIIAAFATLSLGVVLGPEAPLIAIGSGMGVLAVHLIKRDAPEMASVVIGAAGSFAAISTLLGSPLAGAFLLMEAGGLGGALMGVVLVPGLLAAGIGSLIYVGLDDWTGFGDLLARRAEHPAGRQPDRRRVPVGDRDRRSSPRSSAPASAGSRCTLQPIVERRIGAPDPGRRRGDRRPGPGLRRGDRQDRRPTCSSPARISSPR